MTLFKVVSVLAGFLFIVSCSTSNSVHSISRTADFSSLGVMPEADCVEPKTEPEILNKPEAMSHATYSDELIREGIDGEVILELAINEDGEIVAFREKNNADYRLVKQVRDILPYLKLEAGTCNGEKTIMAKEFKMSFRLNR